MNMGDGGYAFPRQLPNVEVSPDEALEIIERYSGMTLRDYLAGQALAGMLARGDSLRWTDQGPYDQSTFADSAYKLADAMLKRRLFRRTGFGHCGTCGPQPQPADSCTAAAID